MPDYIRRPGWLIVIIATVFVPIILWLPLNPPATALTSIWSFLGNIGRLAGIIGVCFYAVNLILSTRWRFTEKAFGGLNVAYKAHHIIGGIALILLLFHPVFLAISKVSVSWYQAVLLLLPGVSLAINLGILALIGLVFLLILTFYVKLPYALWRFSHKFLGVFFGIAVIHILLIDSSDMESSPMLKAYVLALAALGLAAYTYRSLLPKIFVRSYSYVVEKVNLLKPNVIEIMMAPKNQLLSFKPGQFVFVSFENSPLLPPEAHPFSIASASVESRITITAKMLGDYTAALAQLRPGTAVRIEGAYGGFSYTNFSNHNQIWIAGGIGITPFVSMARDLANKPDFRVDLYYSCKTKDEFVYLDVLFYDLAKSHPNFRVITWAADKMGNLTAEAIKQYSQGVEGKEVFICGPPPMMKAIRTQFRVLGTPNKQIHSEEFSIQ